MAFWSATLEWASKELVGLIYHLLPGFVAAWVFYGLTTHVKPPAFERVVQALIFTVVVQALTVIVRGLLLLLGRAVTFGAWTDDCALVWSVMIALGLGLLLAALTNHDVAHRWLRRCRLTSRTSYPSEWYSVFAREKRWVTLHLSGDRRLFGWPAEWPDQPDAGHFVIENPEWLLDDGQRTPLYRVAKIAVPAKDVEMVEFSKYNYEMVGVDEDAVEHADAALRKLRDKEQQDGSQSTPAAPR